MWVWNRFVNRACFHVNGIKRYHWLAIQGIRQCHPCWQCFNKNLIHVPNIWTPTLTSYSCGLIQISLTDNDSRMVWDLMSSIYVWHLFLAPTISGFILEVVTKESFLFLERTFGLLASICPPKEVDLARISTCGLLRFLWLRLWWLDQTCNVFINYTPITFTACHWNKIQTLLITLGRMKLFSPRS